jgi:hypothetical protein
MADKSPVERKDVVVQPPPATTKMVALDPVVHMQKSDQWIADRFRSAVEKLRVAEAAGDDISAPRADFLDSLYMLSGRVWRCGSLERGTRIKQRTSRSVAPTAGRPAGSRRTISRRLSLAWSGTSRAGPITTNSSRGSQFSMPWTRL